MDPFSFLFAIGLMVASYAVTTAMMTKPQVPKPAAFEDFDFPQVDEGTPQAVFFGDCWTADWCVLWYGNYRTSEIRRKG